MDTRKFFSLKTQFDFVNKGFITEFLHGNMFRVADSFWVFVCKFLFGVFGSIIGYIFRLQSDKIPEKNECDYTDQIDSNCAVDSKIDGLSEKVTGIEYSDINKGNRESENSTVMESGLAAITSKYQFTSGMHISGFMEPKTVSFTVHEYFLGPNGSTYCDNPILDTEVSAYEDFRKFSFETAAVDQTKTEESVESLIIEKVLDKQEQETFTEHESSENGEAAGTEYELLGKDDSLNEFPFPLEDCSLSIDSNPDTIDIIDESSISNHNTESITYEFLAKGNPSEGLEPESPVAIDSNKEEVIETTLDPKTVVLSDHSDDSDDEYIELEPHLENFAVLDEEILSREDLSEVEDNHEQEDLVDNETETIDGLENFEERSWLSFSDSDDEDDFDFLSENHDIIEQLKMELKYVRTGGLPTILEDSESPRMVEELKPLMMIDEKFDHKDRMKEIQKVYKSYSDKMRKLDILSSQTMHAIGLLNLKDPTKLNSTRKSSVPAIKSLLSQNLCSCKQWRPQVDPTKKFLGDLHRDFEMVYVGQVCLSWEILHWQYGKAQELQEYDSQELRQYNQVADEFQRFQVLVQRFIENEQFQGPRVQNYVKNRCVRCNLLQVPAIQDDCSKDKRKGRTEERENAISSAMLTEIIEESIRVFWEFLRTDKDEANVFIKGPQQKPQVDVQDPVDSELLKDIRMDLQKKEKKLKEILRSGNCIVKKFQKHQAARLNWALFFAQVELKLVSRVLTMSKLTTDQLVWCHEKLDKINFVNRKIKVEPSFLLFPC